MHFLIEEVANDFISSARIRRSSYNRTQHSSKVGKYKRQFILTTVCCNIGILKLYDNWRNSNTVYCLVAAPPNIEFQEFFECRPIYTYCKLQILEGFQ